MSRIIEHPILGTLADKKEVKILVDGKECMAYEGDMIAFALFARSKKVLRYTKKYHEPRGVFCGIGKCTDCMMTVNGVLNVRTCITPVEEGMIIKTQHGLGKWERSETYDS